MSQKSFQLYFALAYTIISILCTAAPVIFAISNGKAWLSFWVFIPPIIICSFLSVFFAKYYYLYAKQSALILTILSPILIFMTATILSILLISPILAYFDIKANFDYHAEKGFENGLFILGITSLLWLPLGITTTAMFDSFRKVKQKR